MHDHTDLNNPNHFRHMIKVGVVSKVKADSSGRPLAKIAYPDRQGVTTAWFPVMQRNTVGTVDFSCVRVGEMAVVLHLGTGMEQGIVLGSIYTDKVTTSVTDVTTNKRTVVFDDGTIIQFNPSTSTTTINSNGPVNVTTTGNVTINC